MAKKAKKDYVAIAKPAEFLAKTPMAKKVTLYKLSTGQFFVGGGRGSSKNYRSIAAIPAKVIDWVESTM